MIKNVQSLMAKANNLAKEKNISVQQVLQYYMFECFLERLSFSEYKEKFILKGRIFIIIYYGNRYKINHGYRCKHYRTNF